MTRLGYKHDKALDAISDRYWTNTISPLLENGSLERVLEGKYQYPNRIGLYPGINCQFFCTFCGRNYDAKYSKSAADKSLDVFQRVIDQDPKTDTMWADRFRISGGLEPLTNPNIGKIISYGHNKGFNMQMYTNGYALTESFLEKQPGIFDLEVMRVSLYGHDAQSYFAVTKNKKSFEMVKNNLSNFCRIMKGQPKMKLGVNWIILPGHSNDLIPVFKMISDINSQSDFKISFITLREDFSQSNNFISDEERLHLKENFSIVESMIDKDENLKDLHIDYGYALYPVRQGIPQGPLKMATYDQMDSHGFPQISTAVDSLGSLYVYHESGFYKRPGSDRYIIGNINEQDIQTIVQTHLDGRGIRPRPFDVGFMDAFDHTITLLVAQAKQFRAQGLDWKKELERTWKR